MNLNSFLLTGSGNLVFTSGTVSNGTLTVNAGTGNTASFVNTTLSANATLNVTTGAITLSGGLYNGPVSFNQTGAVQTTGLGGATFNSTLVFVNSGTNHMRINGNCTFNGVTTFSNVGTGYFLPELASGNTYNSTLNLINNSTSNLRMAYLGATTINGNLLVNNLGTGNVEFCEQATATCSLTAGNTIAVGSIGFNSGVYYYVALHSLVQPHKALLQQALVILALPTTVCLTEHYTPLRLVIYWQIAFTKGRYIIQKREPPVMQQVAEILNQKL